MDISVIIVNYKTVSLILDCLESIYIQTSGIDFEIIVVDNNSGDNFQEIIHNKYSDVICLPLVSNVGFGRANNEGLRLAKGRNILFLNPDTRLLNNALKILSDYMDSHPNVGVCGGNLFDANMCPMHSYRMLLPGILYELNGLLHSLIDKVLWGRNAQFNHTETPLEVGYITGADMMVRCSVLDKVGSFSPEFFMYYEETELTYRIIHAGYAIVSIPSAKIQHLEGQSFRDEIQINKWRIRCQEHGHRMYYKLTHGNLYQRFAGTIYCLTLVSHMPFHLINLTHIKVLYARLKSFIWYNDL